MPTISSKVIEVCIFKRSESGVRYLLFQRSEEETLHPNIWQLMTGMIEEGEEAMQAALREFGEETGLQSHRMWVVPFVDIFYSAHNDAMNLCPFFAIEVVDGQEPTLSNEHQVYRWLTYEEARQRLVWSGQKQGLTIVDQYSAHGNGASEFLELHFEMQRKERSR